MLSGHWQSYIDCPTDILTFENNQKVTLSSCNSEYIENASSGTSYKIIGNKAITTFNGDKYEFTLDQNDINKLNVVNKSKTVIFSKKIQD